MDKIIKFNPSKFYKMKKLKTILSKFLFRDKKKYEVPKESHFKESVFKVRITNNSDKENRYELFGAYKNLDKVINEGGVIHILDNEVVITNATMIADFNYEHLLSISAIKGFIVYSTEMYFDRGEPPCFLTLLSVNPNGQVYVKTLTFHSKETKSFLPNNEKYLINEFTTLEGYIPAKTTIQINFHIA